MEFNEEILYQDNLKYLLTFGRENDSIKSLVFNGDSISIDNDESVDVFHQIMNQFNGESIIKIILRSTKMNTTHLKQITTSFGAQAQL